MSGQAGDPRALYAAERARALARQRRQVPADPQQSYASDEDPRELVADMMIACTAWAAAWQPCGHPELNHCLDSSGAVAWCSIATAAGRCGCERFRPGRHHDFGPDGRELECRACGLYLLDLAGLCEPAA